jgi:predicted Zn-dependent protease
LYAVRFGSEVYRFIFAAKARTTQVDLAFRESIMSFRRMTLKESQQVRPLRLKIVTVGPNDTVEKFAHRMAISDHSLERFRTLNGLGQQDRLKPGEKVKVVVE